MRIQTVKKGIRSNHTIRWAGYGEGTKRNGVINGRGFINNACRDGNVIYIKNTYKKYFPSTYFSKHTQFDEFDESYESDKSDEFDESDDKIINITPRKYEIIKYDSHLRCCQMCGGSRFSCKAVFHEQNQYGKGVYRQGKKFKESPMNIYYDYLDSLDD
jgi:hypothetical protein